MLGSNFLANARLLVNTNAVNLVFAINFIIARVYNQLPFIKLAVRDSLELTGLGDQFPSQAMDLVGRGTGKAQMWESHWTTALVVAWALLVVLNLFWSFKVAQVMYWKLTGQTRSTKKKKSS